MHKYLPFFIVFIILGIAGVLVVSKKSQNSFSISEQKNYVENIGRFDKTRSCARPPQFLKQLNIPQPVMIDLSQKRFKGIALLYGKGFGKVLHPKQWEQYEHFSTYTMDKKGNIYLVPTPFISIYPTTFNLQKNIYKLDSKTGKISIFMHLDNIMPSSYNPYGLNAIVYDCDDNSLWVASIDKSNYQSQKGIIYHIDIQSKDIVQKVEGVDVLSMQLLQSNKGKYLLVGSARDNGLYAFTIQEGRLSKTATKLLELPNINVHIRKIKIKGKNRLELQSIPFTYTLIAQSDKKDRMYYEAIWKSEMNNWYLKKILFDNN